MSTTDGRPDGYTTLTPFLVCSPAREAIAFYERVFGATVVSVMDAPDGSVAHAELQLLLGRMQLSDPMEGHGLTAPTAAAGQGVSSSVAIYVPDVDAVHALAVQAGATVREGPSTFVTGDRFCSVIDPFGHRWAIMTRVEDVDPEEAGRRLAEWGAQEL